MLSIIDQTVTLINGTEYSWSNITIQFGNHFKIPLVGVQSIEYKIDRPSEHLTGVAGQIVGRKYAAKRCSASIELHMSEVEAILSATKSHDITKIKPFDIFINYIPIGGVPVFKTLKGCQFLNNGTSITQGQTLITLKLDLIVIDIEEKSIYSI